MQPVDEEVTKGLLQVSPISHVGPGGPGATMADDRQDEYDDG